MNFKRLFVSIVLLSVGLGVGLVEFSYEILAQKPPESGNHIDVHMHFSNQISKEWMQKQMKGRSSQKLPLEFTDADYLACADSMIELMDKYELQKVVVMPQPRISGQQGYYDYSQLLPAMRKYRERLVLGAGGGILNSFIHSTDPEEVTGGIQDEFRAQAKKMVKAGAKVFGELAILHLSMNQQHVFEEANPDHPLFLLLAEIAAEHDMPIDIHMETVVDDGPTPANLSRVSSHNPSVLKANIPAFERLLAHNRKAKIIWQHMGWDNTGQMTIALLRRMLKDHPNLYLGFKIEERETQMGTNEPMLNRIVDKNFRITDDWMQFFKDFSDRLLVSADQFVGIAGKTQRAPQYMEQTYRAIKQLPADVLLKVARDNAIRIYNLE